MYYFDNNGTTYLHSKAKEAWLDAYSNNWFNPSSLSSGGAKVHALIDQCRQVFASSMGCLSEDIYFTSGATEASNSLFMYFKEYFKHGEYAAISSIEHASVRDPAEHFFKDRLISLKVDSCGVIDLTALEEVLAQGKVKLVSVMALNNEMGALQPWKEIQKLCREYKAWYHCDASQWLGKMPVEDLGDCDFITGCAHKFSGPKATGFLKIHSDFSDFRVFWGGSQENGHRPGTEDYPSIAAMTEAFKLRNEYADVYQADNLPMRQDFELSLKTTMPEVKIVSEGAERIWNTLSIIFPEFEGNKWVAQLEALDVYVATRAACSQDKKSDYTTLSSLGYSSQEVKRAIRISSGWETTPSDWSALLDAILHSYNVLKQENQMSSVISL